MKPKTPRSSLPKLAPLSKSSKFGFTVLFGAEPSGSAFFCAFFGHRMDVTHQRCGHCQMSVSAIRSLIPAVLVSALCYHSLLSSVGYWYTGNNYIQKTGHNFRMPCQTISLESTNMMKQQCLRQLGHTPAVTSVSYRPQRDWPHPDWPHPTWHCLATAAAIPPTR